uniref:Uncharacterized protein n=1 Tax=Anguilla anguilla TaxID=7936 RepID=A0A0E9XPP6_ANGAN
MCYFSINLCCLCNIKLLFKCNSYENSNVI